MPQSYKILRQTVLPLCHQGKLKRQIRQDVWRALQNMRGFQPIVEITKDNGQLLVTAGGIAMHTHAKAFEQLEAVLENPQNRSRWVNYARAGWTA